MRDSESASSAGRGYLLLVRRQFPYAHRRQGTILEVYSRVYIIDQKDFCVKTLFYIELMS